MKQNRAKIEDKHEFLRMVCAKMRLFFRWVGLKNGGKMFLM